MLNYHVLNDSIVLNYDGKTKVIANGDSRYEKVLDLIRHNNLDDIPGVVEIERQFEGSGIELRDGILTIENEPMPSELHERILKFKEQGLSFASLLLFWEKLKKNPSYNARRMLFKFLEHNGHPLTTDGCFIAYRGVSSDFKDKHTGRFDNSPGAICQIDRNLVDDNPNNTCSTGLHVACFDYAQGFGEKLIEVKVDPCDVVCVPTDYNGTKMRVCRFTVIQESKEINQKLVEDLGEDETDDLEWDDPDYESHDYCWHCWEDDAPNYEADEIAEPSIQEADLKAELAKQAAEEASNAQAKNYRHAKRDAKGRFKRVSRKKAKKAKKGKK